MSHKELIARLRSGAGIARERVVYSGLAPLADEAADMIEALQAELNTTEVLLEECKMDWSGDVTQIKAEHKHEVDILRQQLAEAQRDAERYRWLRDNSASISWNPSRFNAEIVSGFSHSGTGYLGFSFEDAIKEAMKGTA